MEDISTRESGGGKESVHSSMERSSVLFPERSSNRARQCRPWMRKEATYRAGQKRQKPQLTHQLVIPQREGGPGELPQPLAPERCLLGRLCSACSVGMNGRSVGGEARERERGYLVSGSKNGTFTEARPRSVGGRGHAKSGPSRSGRPNATTTSDERATTPASFVSWRVRSGERLLGNGLERPS